VVEKKFYLKMKIYNTPILLKILKKFLLLKYL